VCVFVIVSSAVVYSGAKVKKENIIDALKQENI
jgi:putative ABC transport system permease protein